MRPLFCLAMLTDNSSAEIENPIEVNRAKNSSEAGFHRTLSPEWAVLCPC